MALHCVDTGHRFGRAEKNDSQPHRHLDSKRSSATLSFASGYLLTVGDEFSFYSKKMLKPIINFFACPEEDFQHKNETTT